MNGLDYWKLCDEVTIVQAALLIAGCDPSESQEYILNWEPHNRPKGFDAAFAALTHAVLGGRLRCTIRTKEPNAFSWLENPRIEERIVRDEAGELVTRKHTPDWALTTVTVDHLREWMRNRGIRTGFFFPTETEWEDYLNPADEHYSPKLAAAVHAWEAVSRDPSALRGKTVKQALLIWLRRHAENYGLTKDDGNPNELGIEEISKIANWDTKGGAPKTPGE